MLHLAYNIYHYIQIAKRYNINKVILKLEHDPRKFINLELQQMHLEYSLFMLKWINNELLKVQNRTIDFAVI